MCYPELKANELLRVRDEVIKEITAVDDELGAKEDAFKVLFFLIILLFGRVHGGDRENGSGHEFLSLPPIT